MYLKGGYIASFSLYSSAECKVHVRVRKFYPLGGMLNNS